MNKNDQLCGSRVAVFHGVLVYYIHGFGSKTLKICCLAPQEELQAIKRLSGPRGLTSKRLNKAEKIEFIDHYSRLMP